MQKHKHSLEDAIENPANNGVRIHPRGQNKRRRSDEEEEVIMGDCAPLPSLNP